MYGIGWHTCTSISPQRSIFSRMMKCYSVNTGKSCKLQLVVMLAFAMFSYTSAWVTVPLVHTPAFHSRSRIPLKSHVEYSSAEVDEMEQLILSISKEPTDDARRTRLKNVFTEALARPNGAPKRFSDLFDLTLIVIGDRVKIQAEKKALEAQEATSTSDPPTEESKQEQQNEAIMGKTAEERQLWALVDMLVQSKTIVKRANGDLGSRGNFG